MKKLNNSKHIVGKYKGKTKNLNPKRIDLALSKASKSWEGIDVDEFIHKLRGSYNDYL